MPAKPWVFTLKSQSEIINWRFDVNTVWPDIDIFYQLFDCKISVGMFNLDVFKTASPKMVMDQTNRNIFLDQAEMHTTVMMYHTKSVYHEVANGNKWHTPISVYAYHDKNQSLCFNLTKGYKKICAARLLGIKKLPTVFLHSKNITVSDAHLINSDSDLVDYLKLISAPEPVDSPQIGIEFKTIDNRIIPVIHFIDINQQAALRPNWSEARHQDTLNWRSRGRIILSNFIPKEPHEFFQFEHCEDIDNFLKQPRDRWPDRVCAVIRSHSPNNTYKLADMAVWFSADAGGKFVSQATDGRGQDIYYPKISDITTNINPYLIDNWE